MHLWPGHCTHAPNILAVAKFPAEIGPVAHICARHRGLAQSKVQRNMLGFSEPTVYEASKCFFSYGRLSHLDPQQLPTAWEAKGKPWSSAVLDGFVSRVGASPVMRSTHTIILIFTITGTATCTYFQC